MKENKEILVTGRDLKKRSIVAFSIFFIMILMVIFGWKWLNRQPKDNGIPSPLRAALNGNETFFSNYIYSTGNFSRVYDPAEAAPKVRVNGDAGVGSNFDPNKWKLQVIRKEGDTLFVNLNEIKALPQTQVVFDFKCIEGWSQVTHWGGVRFSDFVKKYNLTTQAAMKYVGLDTPDKEYYVGIDTRSIMHPQTLLCYEMNGRPLPMDQGFPLRLIIPVKYGIKHLKRIGSIYFSNQKPKDYWYERGYDYYSGL